MRKFARSLLLVILLASCVQPARDIYLPWVPQPAPTSPQPTPTATPDPTAACFGDESAHAFYRLLIADSRQEHPRLLCWPALVNAARWRAAGLASGDPWAHCDAAGVCANEYARQAGCKLPASYAAKGNNVETLGAGSPVAEAVFAALANSPAHAAHLFGRGEFFRQQWAVGIARAEGGAWGWYWAVMIAVCE